MIDTIVITLNPSQYQITNPDKFTPSASLLAVPEQGVQVRQNPTAKELLMGIYKPKLTLTRRLNPAKQPTITLRIELSLPKLLFNNNFNELQYKDFARLINKLVTVLAEMGVSTSAAILAVAPVSAIHYAKNFPLTDGATPYYFINKLKSANIQMTLDVNQTDYRNDGHAYRWHCNAYEVVFYDKLADLEKARVSAKRAVEKDNTIQLNLFEQLKKRTKLEFLRMEVRLNQRAKMRTLFKKLKISAPLTFKRLFKPAIAKRVLLHYIDQVESKRPSLLDYSLNNHRALLADLIFNNPKLSPKQIFQVLGFRAALAELNPRELRAHFPHYHQRSWYRLMAEMQRVQLAPRVHSFATIRKQLVQFKPVKLAI
ncbi:MAG TPA: hypothetical protein VJJ81_01930 [Candidatus Babeliales bacterium]|nr:hypothetical protein [Candidatus Babeliales bacterium]